MTEMEDELCQAIQKDHGKSSFVTFMGELGILKVAAEHDLSMLKTWMTP